MFDFIKKIYKFLSYEIWTVATAEFSRTKRFGYGVVKTIFLAIRGYINNHLGVRAAALTYYLIFATVPLIALMIAIAKGFGLESYIESMLTNTFVAQANLVPQIMAFVEHYLDTIRGGVFMGIGLVILIYSVLNFFNQVESIFNDIWQVEKPRSILRKFTNIFSGLFIFPLLMVLSSGLSIYINAILANSFLYEIFTPFIRILVKSAPFLVSWLMFTILYLAIPNTKVRFLNALLAGIIAGTIFQLFQTLYISGQLNLTRYNAVYGGFAAIPLLLLWLQTSSLIVLIGAEISYASQNLKYFDYEKDSKNISKKYYEYLTLLIAYKIVKRYENNKRFVTAEAIIRSYKLPIRLVNKILNNLKKSDVVIEVRQDNTASYYVPAIDINQLTVGRLFLELGEDGTSHFLKNENEEMSAIWDKFEQMSTAWTNQLETVLIKDLTTKEFTSTKIEKR